MRLTKLSLAAIVAVGAFGSFASAAPLEEAIKGVDVSGFARLRYYNDDKLAVRGGGKDEAIRVSGLLNVSVPVADSLTFGTSLATDGYNHPDIAGSGATGLEFDKFFFQYAANGVVVKAGKFEIPTPWTEAGFGGSRGNGILALYTGVPNWTFAGAAYLQTNGLITDNILGLGQFGANNLYAVAAIGAVGPVNLQVWVASQEQVIDYTVFGEVSFVLAGLNARVQANYLQINKDVYDEASIFVGTEVGYKNDQFYVSGGVTWTNEDLFAYALDADNDGFIKFGKQLYYYTLNAADTIVLGAKGGVNVDKFGFELGAAYADDGTVDEDVVEAYGLVSYKYAKNFGLELYYSALISDYFVENNELRFQAQYNF